MPFVYGLNKDTKTKKIWLYYYFCKMKIFETKVPRKYRNPLLYLWQAEAPKTGAWKYLFFSECLLPYTSDGRVRKFNTIFSQANGPWTREPTQQWGQVDLWYRPGQSFNARCICVLVQNHSALKAHHPCVLDKFFFCFPHSYIFPIKNVNSVLLLLSSMPDSYTLFAKFCSNHCHAP